MSIVLPAFIPVFDRRPSSRLREDGSARLNDKPRFSGLLKAGFVKPDMPALILGLGPLISCVGQPVMTDCFNRQEGLPARERRSLLVQEVIRQGISAGITLASFIGGVLLGNRSSAASKGVAQALWIVGLNFAGYSLMRPWITAKAVTTWLKRAAPSPKQNPEPNMMRLSTLQATVLSTPTGLTRTPSASSSASSSFSWPQRQPASLK